MSDKDSAPRPRSRRPSYLSGPTGSAKAPAPAPVPEPKKEEAPQLEEDTEILRWKVWLLPRRPLVSVVVVVTLLACIGVAYWAFPNFLFVLIITYILLNRLGPYLFPVTYILTEQTAGYKTILTKDIRPWSRVFTFYGFPDGVLLSNDTRNIRGRIREGLFMYYEDGAANKDQVLEVVKSKLKPPEEALAPKSNDKEFKGGIGSAMRRLKKLKDKD